MENINKSYRDFLYLLNHFLRNKEIDSNRLKEINFNDIFAIAKKHSVTALFGYYLKDVPLDDEIYNKFNDALNGNIRKTLMFNAERNKIVSFFEEYNIRYVFLKGILVNDYYPNFGLREFADNDILIDPLMAKQATMIFKDMDYECNVNENAVHNSYYKRPFYNFEIHRSLFAKNHPFYSYYKDVKPFLIKDAGNDFGYHFNDNEFYIYILAHDYKHYSNGGNGIRFLIDLYFINRALSDKLDYKYINEKLKELGIFDFYRMCKKVINKLFTDDELNLTKEEEQFVSYVLQSGTYGNLKTMVDNKLNENNNKFRYLLKRAFPDYSWFKDNYPFLAKTIIFIPFFVLFRLFRAFIIKGKSTFTEIKLVKEYNHEKE